MDSLPLVSQVKSCIQLLSGDSKGALKTQENFFEAGLLGSQLKSLIDFSKGDFKRAWWRQAHFIENTVNGIPIAGHMKGIYHLVNDDRESFEAVMKSSSRPVGVAIGGVLGFFAGGPPGAFGGGTVGGLYFDALTSVIETSVKGEQKPYGTLELLCKIGNGEGDSLSGDIFDFLGIMIVDGAAGVATGETVGRQQSLKLMNEEVLREAGVSEVEIGRLESSMEKFTGHDLKRVQDNSIQAYEMLGENKKMAKQIAEQSWLERGENTHNPHALWREPENHGQVAIDKHPQIPGQKRGPERVIVADRYRNYQLHVENYTETHDYTETRYVKHREAWQKPFDTMADNPKLSAVPHFSTFNTSLDSEKDWE